jgi:U4/U6.U5 tri-snRNP-associated protein 1
MEESISLEETNKIRISLGLKPLTDDSAPADNADKKAEDNYNARREQEQKDRDAKKVQDRIAKCVSPLCIHVSSFGFGRLTLFV